MPSQEASMRKAARDATAKGHKLSSWKNNGGFMQCQCTNHPCNAELGVYPSGNLNLSPNIKRECPGGK